jgi:putative FmdB family regulatory protein
VADESGGLTALPTYEYRCISCEHQFERFQRMSDDPVKECEVCGEPVKRLLFPVAIQFKGNGFYTTDYARRSALGSAGSNTAGTAVTESASSSESAGAAKSSGAGDNGKPAASGASDPVTAGATTKSD